MVVVLKNLFEISEFLTHVNSSLVTSCRPAFHSTTSHEKLLNRGRLFLAVFILTTIDHEGETAVQAVSVAAVVALLEPISYLFLTMTELRHLFVPRNQRSEI